MTYIPPPSSAGQRAPATVGDAVKIGRIITLAIAAGPVVLTIVAVGLAMQPPAPGANPPQFFGPLAVALTVLAAPAALLVPKLLRRASVQSLARVGPPPDAWDETDPAAAEARAAALTTWTTGHLASIALWEGAAMAGAVFFLIGRDFLCLVPVVVGVGAVLARFPSALGVQAAVDGILEEWRLAREQLPQDR